MKETEVLNGMEKVYGNNDNSFIIESLGPVECLEEKMEEDTNAQLVIKTNSVYKLYACKQNIFLYSLIFSFSLVTM